MNNSIPRPTPEDKRNAAPMDPEGRARMDARHRSVNEHAQRVGVTHAQTGSMAALATGASWFALALSIATEMGTIRESEPEALAGFTPEGALTSFANAIMAMTTEAAEQNGINPGLVAYAFKTAMEANRPNVAMALAAIEKGRAIRAGNPAPTKPNLDLSNLI